MPVRFTPIAEAEKKKKRAVRFTPSQSPQQGIRAKIQAGKTPSRRDTDALGVELNRKQRKILADTVRRQRPLDPTGMVEGFEGMSTEGMFPRARKPAKLDPLGVLQLPSALTRGTELFAGTATGGIMEFLGRRAAAKTPGEHIAEVTKMGPIASRIMAPVLDRIIPKQVDKIFDKQNQVLTKTGKKVSAFFEEAAKTGWEAPDPELLEAKWDRPIAYATSVSGEALPATIAALGVGALTKSPSLALIMMGGVEKLNSFQDQIEKGASFKKADLISSLSGAWEAATEKVPFDFILKGNMDSRLFKALTAGQMEGVQEVLAGMGQNFLQHLGYNTNEIEAGEVPDAVKDAAKHTFDSFFENWVAGAFMGTVGGGAFGVRGRGPTAKQLAKELGIPTKGLSQEAIAEKVRFEVGRRQLEQEDVERVLPVELAPDVLGKLTGRPSEAAVAREGVAPIPEAPIPETESPRPEKGPLETPTRTSEAAKAEGAGEGKVEATRDTVRELLRSHPDNAQRSDEQLDELIASEKFRHIWVKPEANLGVSSKKIGESLPENTGKPIILDENIKGWYRPQSEEGPYGVPPYIIVLDGQNRLIRARQSGQEWIPALIGEKAAKLLHKYPGLFSARPQPKAEGAVKSQKQDPKQPSDPQAELHIAEEALAQAPAKPKKGTQARTEIDNLNKPITREEKGLLQSMGMTTPEILKGKPAELRKKIAVDKNARRRMGGFFNLPINTPEPSTVRRFFETIYQNRVNRFASIENAETKAKRLGMEIPPSSSAKLLSRLYLGLGRKAESVLRDNTFSVNKKGQIVITGEGLKPILDSYDQQMTKFEPKRKARDTDLTEYLFAVRTIEDLQRPAREHKPDFIVSPEEVAKARKDLARIKKKYGKRGIATIEKHAERLYAMQRRVFHLLVEGGNMSQAQFDKIIKQNRHYISFARVLPTDAFAGVPVSKDRFTKARAPFHTIRGTELKLEKQDPIESIIRNTHRIIEASERNKVARSVARLAKVLPGDIKPVRIKMFPIKVDPAEILTVVKQFRSKSAKITQEFKDVRTEGGKTADVSGPLKKLEGVVKEALTSRGFSEGEANSFIQQIRKGKPVEGGQEATHTTETIRQIIKETQKIITSEVPVESTIFRPSQFAPKGNTIEYYENGKRRYIEVSTNLYAAMTGLTEEGASTVANILSHPAHWLRVGATITPEFMVRNPIRDQFTALMQSSFGFVPFIDTAAAIADVVGKTDVYKDWIRSGAAHSGFVELSRPALKKAYKQLRTTRGRQIISKLNVIADAQDISQIMEEATRVAIFKRATRKGLSDMEAGFEAREATVDFARRGAKMANWNKTVAFFNANIQGFDKTIRNAIKHPYSTALKGVMTITLPSLLLYLRNRDDPEYQELAQWKKDLFWNFKLAGIWWRVPKPHVYGMVFGSLQERFFEYLDTKDRKAFDGLANSLLEVASPLGADPAEALIPTGIKPIVENVYPAGWSMFRERTLFPEHLVGGPKADQYNRYTSETAKQLGEWLNRSPAKIENLITGVTGGTGAHILGGTDVLVNQIKDEHIPKRPKGLADIPLVKGFVSRDPSGPSAQSIADFYLETKRITGLRNSWMRKLKQGRTEAANKMLKKNPELVLGPTLTKFQTALSELSKASDAVAASKATTAQKRQRIKVIDKKRLDLARRANKLIETKRK